MAWRPARLCCFPGNDLVGNTGGPVGASRGAAPRHRRWRSRRGTGTVGAFFRRLRTEIRRTVTSPSMLNGIPASARGAPCGLTQARHRAMRALRPTAAAVFGVPRFLPPVLAGLADLTTMPRGRRRVLFPDLERPQCSALRAARRSVADTRSPPTRITPHRMALDAQPYPAHLATSMHLSTAPASDRASQFLTGGCGSTSTRPAEGGAGRLRPLRRHPLSDRLVWRRHRPGPWN